MTDKDKKKTWKMTVKASTTGRKVKIGAEEAALLVIQFIMEKTKTNKRFFKERRAYMNFGL